MNKEPTQVINCFGSKLHYWSFNNEKPVTLVMIHGFRGTHQGLQRFVDNLGNFRLIVPDLPAFGDSTPMTSRHHDINGYADCIGALINQLGLDMPHLLGHSFGSIVAANLASRRPELIDRLVLVNPIAQQAAEDRRSWLVGIVSFYYWVGKKLPKSAGRALLSNRFIVLLVSDMMAKTKNKSLRKKIHASHHMHFSRFHDPKLLGDIYQETVKSSVFEYASKITKDTLLIVGDVDNIAPIGSQRRLHQLFVKAKMVAIKKVGHLTHHEAPMRVARAIQAFLSAP